MISRLLLGLGRCFPARALAELCIQAVHLYSVAPSERYPRIGGRYSSACSYSYKSPRPPWMLPYFLHSGMFMHGYRPAYTSQATHTHMHLRVYTMLLLQVEASCESA